MNQTIITLDSIAGYEEEKEEARKIIDVLKNLKEYQAKGASVPKGLLLCGDPGVGKTLFAKAIAEEAGVPFYEFSPSTTDSKGQAIESLKREFAAAKKAVPSILFFDELNHMIYESDEDVYSGYQSDYSRRFTQTLLTEIDGISSSEGILIIATVNHKESVPAPLIRSGRLEKQITFGLPSIADRTAIAEMYLEKASITNIDPRWVAGKTRGFSGADIKALINQCLIEMVRRGSEITPDIVLSIIPTIRFGEIKKGGIDEIKKPVAYHEIGHFLALYELRGEVGSISVESYGSLEGRVEWDESENDDRKYKSAEDILDEIPILLGGMAGEEVFLGKRFCGGGSDVNAAIKLIRGVIQSGALGFEIMFPTGRDTFPNVASYVQSMKNNPNLKPQEQLIVSILNSKMEKAIDAVSKHKRLGEILVQTVMEKGTLSKEEIEPLIGNYRNEA